MSEEQYPLPWNPDESCNIDNESVDTRLDTNQEVEGTLFNRVCDGLDNTIPRRKDRFITTCPDDLPDVPKKTLKNKKFELVPFPGTPLTEIPKALLAQLLGCCLKDRTAGFAFEIEQKLDGNDKAEMDFTDEDDPITTTLSIQFGTYSYLLIGLDIKPELCFCDEDCGDEDYIHIKINLAAEYHDEDGDNINENPDLEITDEQLTNLISNYGGGGGGNPLCAQKLFGVYTGLTTASAGYFVPYGLVSYTASDLVYAYLAPYLAGFELVPNGIYKLEYFCEYRKWYVTDGQCSNLAPVYAYPSYVLVEAIGLAGETKTGTLILQNGGETYPYDDYTVPLTFDSSESTDSEENVYVNGITFTRLNEPGIRIRYSFQIKEDADDSMVYTTLLSHTTGGSCDSKGLKVIFKVKDNTSEVELEGEGE